MNAKVRKKMIADITELMELKRIVDGCDAEMERAKNNIIRELTKINENKVIVGKYKISFSHITRNDIDTDALKINAPNVFDNASYTTTYRTFKVK